MIQGKKIISKRRMSISTSRKNKSKREQKTGKRKKRIRVQWKNTAEYCHEILEVKLKTVLRLATAMVEVVRKESVRLCVCVCVCELHKKVSQCTKNPSRGK
jgi:hypothetical protein